MRISAKDLGWLAVEDFCPRCFWIERHAKGLPFQMGFPGIFSSIDAYTKNIVERYVQKNAELPKWMSVIGDIKRIVAVKPSEFKVEKQNITLSGIPDLIFERHNGDFVIVDYKTAKYTGNQDELMPIYQIQLNGYAYIAEALGYKPVKDLYLVYFEPPYKEMYETITDGHTNGDGFEMPFKPKIHKIKRDAKEIDRLLEKASKIYEQSKAPKGLNGCKDCERLDNLIDMAKT
jgi:CRISPR/Cas system-associated exonuclease Cas4 (RecB family)